MDETGAISLELALSSVLTARLDGAARPALLAAVRGVPAQRRPAEDRPEAVRGAQRPQEAQQAQEAQARRS